MPNCSATGRGPTGKLVTRAPWWYTGDQLRRDPVSRRAFLQRMDRSYSEQIVDAIVAEDIGKLPDIAVSDTAARIPGFQVERARGEAGRVLLRGLDENNYTTTYNGREIFTAYVPQPSNPVFMTLIEKTFGKDLTTRTWDTVKKCAAA